MNERSAGGGLKVTIGCPACGRLNRVDLARAGSGARCGACGGPLPLDRPSAVTDQNLERVIREAEVPVLVDFHADWCAPCRMMEPVLEALARERSGELLIAKLDTDRNPAMAVRFAIRGIPNLILFLEGREFAREVGVVSRAKLEELIERGIAATR